MAYPTTISFKAVNYIGAQPIGTTSTTQQHPIGTIVKAVDPVYGEGEFIYLKGLASTAAGDAVVYGATTGVTTRTVAASDGPVGIAMSANVANQYGWYQISGNGVVLSAGATIDTVCGTSATPGSLGNTGATVQVTGMIFRTAQDAPGSGYTGVTLARPSCNLLG